MRDGFYLSDHRRDWADMYAGRHVGRDLLLFWPQFENIYIHQALDVIIEDIAAFGWVTDQSMVCTILWIVDLVHLIWSAWLRQLETNNLH